MRNGVNKAGGELKCSKKGRPNGAFFAFMRALDSVNLKLLFRNMKSKEALLPLKSEAKKLSSCLTFCLLSLYFLPHGAAQQPKQIKEIKDFLLTARRRDARSVKIKKNGSQTKFKVR